VADHLLMGKPSRYVTTYSNQLNVVIPLWAETISINKVRGVQDQSMMQWSGSISYRLAECQGLPAYAHISSDSYF